MKKKFMALLMALVLVISMLPTAALAAEGDVAKIGEQGYATLQAAFEAVQDNEIIEVLSNVTISSGTAGYTDGTYTDGVRYTSDTRVYRTLSEATSYRRLRYIRS